MPRERFDRAKFHARDIVRPSECADSRGDRFVVGFQVEVANQDREIRDGKRRLVDFGNGAVIKRGQRRSRVEQLILIAAFGSVTQAEQFLNSRFHVGGSNDPRRYDGRYGQRDGLQTQQAGRAHIFHCPVAERVQTAIEFDFRFQHGVRRRNGVDASAEEALDRDVGGAEARMSDGA